jgi:branched-chain amino acid transport system permease protein
MDFLIQQLISGLAVGSTYSLVALGFVLTFGVLNILNIAHVQTIMLAPMSIALLVESGMPIGPAVVISLFVVVAFGCAVFFVGLRPFTGAGEKSTYLASFIASFGISMLVENFAGTQLGTDPRPFPPVAPADLWRIGSIIIVPMSVITLGVVLVTVAGLAYVVTSTTFGREMRAVAENPYIAATQGISINRTIMTTVVCASLLGGISGVLFAAQSHVVTPFMGFEYGLKGLVVMIVGGITSPAGAVIAGLLLGALESVTVVYISSVYRDVITYGILFGVLVLRPQGLFIGASREARP